MSNEIIAKRLRQYIGKASFSHALDRCSALECLEMLTSAPQEPSDEVVRLRLLLIRARKELEFLAAPETKQLQLVNDIDNELENTD